MAGSAIVTDDTFAELVLNSKTPVLVDYWADWCGPCKQIAPIVDEIAREYEGRLIVLKLDTSANPRIPTIQGVMGLPTLQIFKNGEVVASVTGGKTKMALKRFIDGVL